MSRLSEAKDRLLLMGKTVVGAKVKLAEGQLVWPYDDKDVHLAFFNLENLLTAAFLGYKGSFVLDLEWQVGETPEGFAITKNYRRGIQK